MRWLPWVLLAGCAHVNGHTVVTGLPAGEVRHRGSVVLLWTLVGEPAEEGDCPQGIAWSSAYVPVWAIPLNVVTLGLVTFFEHEYACVRSP